MIYPTGAMIDCENKFWLPFKGFTKPVYAIPGNHDWYDALEGFAVTFYKPTAAARSLMARAAADLEFSQATAFRVRIDLEEATRLRQLYKAPLGFQEVPYFQVQTPEFALIALDTGVLRRLDPDQDQWLRADLQTSPGLRPADAGPNAQVEFVLPLSPTTGEKRTR